MKTFSFHKSSKIYYRLVPKIKVTFRYSTSLWFRENRRFGSLFIHITTT